MKRACLVLALLSGACTAAPVGGESHARLLLPLVRYARTHGVRVILASAIDDNSIADGSTTRPR